MSSKAKKANLTNISPLNPVKVIKSFLLLALALLTVPTASAAYAQLPSAADKAYTSEIIKRIYKGYSSESATSEKGLGEDQSRFAFGIDGYEIPMSPSLKALIIKWDKSLPDDQVFEMNNFDWYCQCQDWDSKSAKIVSEEYKTVDENHINVEVAFVSDQNITTELIFKFTKSGKTWLIDDLIFQYGQTLRKGLQEDIAAAALSNAT
jgi:hypothetical protein